MPQNISIRLLMDNAGFVTMKIVSVVETKKLKRNALLAKAYSTVVLLVKNIIGLSTKSIVLNSKVHFNNFKKLLASDLFFWFFQRNIWQWKCKKSEHHCSTHHWNNLQHLRAMAAVLSANCIFVTTHMRLNITLCENWCTWMFCLRHKVRSQYVTYYLHKNFYVSKMYAQRNFALLKIKRVTAITSPRLREWSIYLPLSSDELFAWFLPAFIVFCKEIFPIFFIFFIQSTVKLHWPFDQKSHSESSARIDDQDKS